MGPRPARPRKLPPRAPADAKKLILFTASDVLGIARGDKELPIGAPGKDVEKRWGDPDDIQASGPRGDPPLIRRLSYDTQGILVIQSGDVVHISVFLEETESQGRTYAASGAVTDKGIGRGATRADVLKAYGKPAGATDEEIQFSGDGGLTRFKFRGDVLYEVSVQ
jgi:hypothetical protein